MSKEAKIIPLKGDYALEVLKAYNAGKTEILISEEEFMKSGYSEQISPANFKMMEYFFSGRDYKGRNVDYSSFRRDEQGNVVLDHEQFINLFYSDNRDLRNIAREAKIAFSNYTNNIYDSDYANKAFVFGSSSFRIDVKKIQYVINQKGEPSIRNFAVIPVPDNFDYHSDSLIAKPVNPLLKYFFSNNIENQIQIKFKYNDNHRVYRDYSLKDFKAVNIKENIKSVLTFSGAGANFLTAFSKMAQTGGYLYYKAQLEPAIDSFSNMFSSWGETKKEVKNDFKVSSSNPLEKTADGKYKYDPVYKNHGWGLWSDSHALNFDHGEKGSVDNTFNAFTANILSNDYRVTNNNFSRSPIIESTLSSKPTAQKDYLKLNHMANFGRSRLPVDPLVLDLNGDGVKLTGYTENAVLFDIDNDGALEETGWVSAEDGLLVRDLNNNGKIDNISEIFSEYYGGRAGRDGESGEKHFRNGFEALRSLDSNHDGLFNERDSGFAQVRVWKDKNQNGITDSEELFDLKSLGITEINLAYKEKGGEYYQQNELLAEGSFSRGTVRTEQRRSGFRRKTVVTTIVDVKHYGVASVNFLANPRGNLFTQLQNGMKVETQSDGRIAATSAFTSTVTTGETLSAVDLGVQNIAAGTGDDVLYGDGQNNWLAGNLGSDTFYAGDGDDVLIIDGDDNPDNIHGGAGNDIIQVVGDKGITIDLHAAEVEAMQGGRGNDVIYSSGNSTIYVRGGDGDDIILGSAANDALSGENGSDTLSGQAGDDVLRGHRGNDYLSGDDGNDLMWGGSDDDVLLGGAGNDMLSGDGGDDFLDGGEGEDIVEYSGNLEDYQFTEVEGGLLISDKVQGRDGTDFVRHVEKANFKNVVGYILPQNGTAIHNPLPVMDIIDKDKEGRLIDGKRPFVITQQQLLQNDFDIQGERLIVAQAFDVQGGQISVNEAREIIFTPDPNYRGVAGFKYNIIDESNHHGLVVGGKEKVGQVYFKTPDLPADPLFYQQYYLQEDNVVPVWQHYTGKNIKIGQFEPSGPFSVAEEVADYRNPELRENIDKDWLYDYEFHTREEDKVFSKHATEVAGVMVGARNGDGGVGVAYHATTASHWVGADTSSLLKMKNYDIANHSWGNNVNFAKQILAKDKAKQSEMDAWMNERYLTALKEGRDGLGTVIVNSAGNERLKGGNANYSYLTSNPYTIVVGSVQLNAQGLSEVAGYSNAGASVLVSAHGSEVVSSSRRLVNKNGGVLGESYSTVDGTSFSAPIVSGVVALMLEANPKLGYRDIQEILSLTARGDKSVGNSWQWNSDKNWNGGGRHVSHDYGYGVVDAQAAVRLAENWHKQETYKNEVRLDKIYSSGQIDFQLEDNSGHQFSVTVSNANIVLENVLVSVNLTHEQASDVIIKLISPSGTESILMNRPGWVEGSDEYTGDKDFYDSKTLQYTFNTALLKGEDPNGQWRLQVFDANTGKTGILHDWSLSLYGSSDDGGDTYIYTDEYQSVEGKNRLSDTDGGFDVINAAAVNGAVYVNLADGEAYLNSKKLSIDEPSAIEGVISGDFDDVLVGNAKRNLLIGGRGDDMLFGFEGDDILYGAQGNNKLSGGSGEDIFVINKYAGNQDILTDFKVGIDKLVLSEFSTLKRLNLQQDAKDTIIHLGDGQTVRLVNVQSESLGLDNVVITAEKFNPLFLRDYYAYGFSSSAQETGLPDVEVVYWGSAGNDRIFGGNKNDTLYGGLGDDVLVGEHSTDQPNGGNDTLYGGDGNDIVRGGAGDDILYGGNGLDSLGGDAGNDTIYLEGDESAIGYDNQLYTKPVTLNNVKFSNASATGGSGNDKFIVVKDTSKGVGRGLLKNLITDFDVNNPNEKIDISQYRGQLSLTMQEMLINGEIYSRLWFGTPGEDTQYITLKGVRNNRLDAIIKNNLTDTSPSVLERLQQTFLGTSQNDSLRGNAVGNYLDGKSGADTMEGLEGDDVYIVDNARDLVIETLNGGYDVIKSNVSYQLSDNVEELMLVGDANINATGNHDNNRLLGNAGANRLDGGLGDDVMIGGKGDDIYLVDSSLDEVVEMAGEGIDKVISSVSYTLSTHLENLTLSGEKPISGAGNGLDNVLEGNESNNRLIGYAGNDTLIGGNGSDFLMGGVGNDTYIFSRGNGNDLIKEESGNDILQFNSGINADQLWFKKSDNDLVINVIGTNDSIIIDDWYSSTHSEDHKIETIIAGDGKRLVESQIDSLVTAMANFDVPAAGQIHLSADYHAKLDTILAANWK